MTDRHEWQRDAAVWLAGPAHRGRSGGGCPARCPIPALRGRWRAFRAWQAAARLEADAAGFAERVRRTGSRAAGQGVRRIDRPPELRPARRGRAAGADGAAPRGGCTRRRWPSWAWRPARGASCSTSPATPGSRCPADLPSSRYVALRVVGDSMLPLLHSGDSCSLDLDARRAAGHGRGGPAPGARLRGQAGAPGGHGGAVAGLAQPRLPALALRAGPRGAARARWCSGGAPHAGRRNRDLPLVRSQGIIRPRAPARGSSIRSVTWRVSSCRPSSCSARGLLGRPIHPRDPAAPAAARGTDGVTAARAMTVPALEGFELAVNRGTRTRTGTPGPKYWQQWADYKLEAELNPVSKRLTGKGTVTYFNRSPDTLKTVYVQLLQNIFAPELAPQHQRAVVGRRRRAEPGGGAGHRRSPAGGEGPGYEVNGTIMRLRLPKPLAAGRQCRLRVRLEAPGAARRRAARRPGRRGLLHQLLVPADGRLRRRQRVADRPVPRQRPSSTWGTATTT